MIEEILKSYRDLYYESVGLELMKASSVRKNDKSFIDEIESKISSLKCQMNNISSLIKESETLTNTEKEILSLFYIEFNSINVIADKLFYCENWVLRTKKRALNKLNNEKTTS